jgi:2-dehydropantoate 2-reductase
LSRIVIWGDGAVGSGLSVTLSRNGHEIELIGPPGSGRGEREISSTGAILGKATVIHHESTDPVSGDVCIVAVKAYILAEISSSALSSADRILCICNGMELDEAWGGRTSDVVEYVVLTMGFHLGSSASVAVSPGMIFVSEQGDAADLFDSTRLSIVRVKSIETVRWAKWLVNSTLNPLGAITGFRNNQLSGPDIDPLMSVLFAELEDVIPDEYRRKAVPMAGEMLEHLVRESGNRCSMLQDLESSRRTEIDFLTGLAEKKLPGKCPTAFAVSSLVRALSTAGQTSV